MFPLGTKGYDPTFHDKCKRNINKSRLNRRIIEDTEIQKRNGLIYKKLNNIQNSKTRLDGLKENY